MNTPYQGKNNELINRRFDDQNKILEGQNRMLERLIELKEWRQRKNELRYYI